MPVARPLLLIASIGCLMAQSIADAQTVITTTPTAAPSARPAPPTRAPDGPGAPPFTKIEGKGANAPTDQGGDFVIGPDYLPAPELNVVEGVPRGTVQQFTLDSKDSKFYPGIGRDVFGTVDPDNSKTLIVATRAAPYQRTITVYIPAQYTRGTKAPFIVTHDGPALDKADTTLPRILDNLIAQKRVPAMIAVMIQNGGGDAQGSQRGLEYDTMSGRFAEFIEAEVLPAVEKNYGVKLTRKPDGRAAMGCSSGAAAALSMAWYHPEWYRRIVSYSGTYVNQQWPFNKQTPGGAWGYHESIIAKSRRKPIRIWMHVGDRDLLNPNVMRDDMHDWVLANHRMAKVLKDKGYQYQYVYALDSGHCDRKVREQTLPQALEWVWRGYPIANDVAAALPPLARVDEALKAYDDHVAQLTREFEKVPAAPHDEAWVKRKLQHMVDVDQYMRMYMETPAIRALSDAERFEFNQKFLPTRWQAVDARNTADLKELLKIHSWFTISEFGAEADKNAWLLVQHADDDREFQLRVLNILEPLAARGESQPKLHAYLFDRLAAHLRNPAERKLQRFGTQGQCTGPGKWEPFPVEDPASLDERRAKVDLPPLAEYQKMFVDVCRESTEESNRKAMEAAKAKYGNVTAEGAAAPKQP